MRLLKSLRKKSNVDEHDIKNMIPKKRSFRPLNQTQKKGNEENDETFETINDKASIGIIKILLHGGKDAKDWIAGNLEIDKTTNSRLKTLIEYILPLMNSSSSDIISAFEDEKDRRIITEIMLEEDSTVDFMHMSIDCLSAIKKDYARQKIQKYRQKIRQMESDGKDTTELMNEVLQIQKDMNA